MSRIIAKSAAGEVLAILKIDNVATVELTEAAEAQPGATAPVSARADSVQHSKLEIPSVTEGIKKTPVAAGKGRFVHAFRVPDDARPGAVGAIKSASAGGGPDSLAVRAYLSEAFNHLPEDETNFGGGRSFNFRVAGGPDRGDGMPVLEKGKDYHVTTEVLDAPPGGWFQEFTYPR